MLRRIIIAGVIGLGVTGAGLASAASLGGVNSQSLGSGDTVVASCDTNGVTIDYDNDYAGGTYKVAAVIIGDVAAPACDGQTISVTLADSSGAALVEVTGTVGGTGTETLTIPALTQPTAEAVVGASVLIAG